MAAKLKMLSLKLNPLLSSRALCLSNKSYKKDKLVRKLSSLGNPMFPERPIPDIPIDNKKTGDDDSFLSRHGGKVGAVALAMACGLFYTYYKSGQLKSEQEDELTKMAAIEPYEINEFRFLNNIPPYQYDSLVLKCLDKFSTEATYVEFVAFVRSRLGISIRSGHIFDRLILAKLQLENIPEGMDGQEQKRDVQSSWSNKFTVPIPYFLVALNMAVGAPASVRCDCLYNLAAALSIDNSSETPVVDQTQFDLSFDQPDKAHTDPGIPIEAAQVILQYLCETWQVPSEKRVIETGIKYPLKTYRRKEPLDMVEAYFHAAKLELGKDSRLTKDQFRELVLGTHVCAWAECYR